jgi:hypothetical protein
VIAEARCEIAVMWPTMPVRLVNALGLHYASRGGISALLRASDAELRAIYMVGPVQLAQLRTVWPEPDEPEIAVPETHQLRWEPVGLTWLGG